MSFLTAEKISELAVALLARSIVLPATVSRVPGQDYTGSGGTTRVRVPQRRTATEYEGSLTYTSIAEDEIDITLARWYDAVNVTTTEASLDIVAFGNQVLNPMVTAIVEAGENALATAMNAVDESFEFGDLTDPDQTKDDVLKIRETLTTNLNPLGGRYLAVAPDVATALLRIPTFVDVSLSGDPSALRDATVGTVFGMQVVESPAIEAGSAVGYSSSGFAFASLAPAPVYGGADSSASTFNGVSLRTVLAYISSTGDNGVLVDTYGGAAAVDVAHRVVRVTTGS